jgi:hypothetical protein
MARRTLVVLEYDGRWQRLALGLMLGFTVGLAAMRQLRRPALVHTPSAMASALEQAAKYRPISKVREEPDGVLTRRHRVAACVGGLLELNIPHHGRSVAENVVGPLDAEVFVAGTLRGKITPSRQRAALETISALRPFARSDLISMPTVEQLRGTFMRASHWSELQQRASGKGSGCLLPATRQGDRDKILPAEKCLALITSPVLGNPRGNTLQALHSIA